jgi:hypothetical protein
MNRRTDTRGSRNSSRWIAEIGGQRTEARPQAVNKADSEDTGKHKEQQQQEFLKKALVTLDMLDERAEKRDERLEQIEAQMGELKKEEEEEEAEKRREEEAERKKEKKPKNKKKRKIEGGEDDYPRRSARLKQMNGGQSRGRLKGAMLMLSLLSVLMPQSKASEVDSADYEMLQGVLRGVAAGLDLVESMAMGVELIEIGRVVQRKQRQRCSS